MGKKKKHKHKWLKVSRAMGRYTSEYCFGCDSVRNFVDHEETEQHDTNAKD